MPSPPKDANHATFRVFTGGNRYLKWNFWSEMSAIFVVVDQAERWPSQNLRNCTPRPSSIRRLQPLRAPRIIGLLVRIDRAGNELSAMNTTPVSLLERLRLPNQQEAWNRFVALYTPLLYHWARRVGLSSTDGADLVQDVLLLMVRKLPAFDYQPGKRFRAWLWTVLVNKYRENHRRRDPIGLAAGAEHLQDISAPDKLEEISEAEYRHNLVRQALHLIQVEFQPNTWKACWESVMEGKSAETLAVELGLSPGAVRAAKFRVLSRLRGELRGLLE